MGKGAGGVQINSTLPFCSFRRRRPEKPLPHLHPFPALTDPRDLCRETRAPPPQRAPPRAGPAPRGSRHPVRAPFGRRGCSGSLPGSGGCLRSPLLGLRRRSLSWCLESRALVSSWRFPGPAGSAVASTGALSACALTRQPICSPAGGL